MSQKPLPDPATRLQLTEELLASVRIPESPPAGFKPLLASSDELKKYGLPPKPDEKANPERYAKWARHLSKPLTFIPPTFKIVKDKQHRLAKNLKKAGNTATSTNWSGYVLDDPSPDQYSIVEGEWIVPNAYPNSTDADCTYYVATWIGIDGDGSDDVLQAGADSYVVVSNGSIVAQSAFPWWEWYPAYPVIFSNFSTLPGDTVWGFVEAVTPTEGYVCLYNVGAGTYTSLYFDAPQGTSCQGNVAEWIVEDPGDEVPFPNFGSTVFFNTWAYCGVWQSPANGGIPINLVENGVTLSEPIVEPSTSFIDVYV